MKKLNLLLFLAATLFLTSACNKDDDGGDDGVNIGGDGCSASWEVNGTNYNEPELASCIYLDNTINLSTNITGGGFLLQINNITSTGTFVTDLSTGSPPFVLSITLTDGTIIGPTEGSTVIVTELSNSKAKGTFSGDFFNLADLMQTPSFSVTNGVFEANF